MCQAFRFPMLIAAVLAAAAVRATPPAAPTPAPSWSLKDLDGNAVTSGEFKGNVLVIDFWATWCQPCRTEIPGYVALQNKYAKDGLVVLGVSTDTAGPAAVKKFIAKNGVTYRILMSDTAVEAGFGGMDAIPTTFIIDRDGMIRDRKVGALPAAQYEKLLLTFLKPQFSTSR